MRVMITGAAGFIGSHLWGALEDHGHEVGGVDNFQTGRWENLTEKQAVMLSSLDIVDRRRFYHVANLLNPEVVIHCAASYKDPDKWHLDTQTNVEGGINASLVAKHHGAHLVYFQTILPPVSSYAISKTASEQYMRLSGVPLTVFRLANIYGPRNLSGPVPVFYKRISEGQPCTIVDTTRDMVFVEDLVRGVVDVVEANTAGTFDMCSGEQSSISDIFKYVRESLGVSDIDSVPTHLTRPESDDVQGTISPLNAPPGWKPTTPLSEGIEKAVHWYQQNGVGDTYTHLKLKG